MFLSNLAQAILHRINLKGAPRVLRYVFVGVARGEASICLVIHEQRANAEFILPQGRLTGKTESYIHKVLSIPLREDVDAALVRTRAGGLPSFYFVLIRCRAMSVSRAG